MALVRQLGGCIVGSEAKTVSTTVVGLTATKYIKSVQGENLGNVLRANYAFVTVEDNPVRVQLDPLGTAPDASSNGHEFAAGDSFIIEGSGVIAGARFIRTGGTDGVLQVTYFN